MRGSLRKTWNGHHEDSPQKAEMSEKLWRDGRKSIWSGLPDFSWYNIPKWGKIYKTTSKYVYQITITIKYAKLPQNIPNM
jgi:hypothetical protein